MGREGKRDGVGLGDSESGLGMEPVDPDKESVERRRGTLET